jgi:ankyrin repeat protein
VQIHHDAHHGDIAGVARELAQGVSLEALAHPEHSSDPMTPLQWAIASPIAGIEMVTFLLSRGAHLSLPPSPEKSDLAWAIASGSIPKIQLLLDRGADIAHTDAQGYDALIHAVYSAVQAEQRIALVQFLIQQGAPLNGRSTYGESALDVASRCGWFDLVQVLLAAGGDCSVLGWTGLMQAIACGTLAEIDAQLAQSADLAAVDAWGRTAWLLSLHTGDLAKAQRLRIGSNPLAVGYYGKLPLMYALESGNLALLDELIATGVDVNATDQATETALMLAVDLDQVEAADVLLRAGAIASQSTKYNRKAIQQARSVAMIERLLAEGELLADIDSAMLCRFTQVESPPVWTLDSQYYYADRYPRLGDRNPTVMASPFWREMVKFRSGAYAARTHYQDIDDLCGEAVWCFSRLGRSITRLPDGRIIEIAGEHEDYYDPDFHIYNDIVVYDGNGDFTIYGYPKDVFPPTDFHTATWVDGWIYIIGNLGYGDDRHIGETPVYRLNCTTFAIESVLTHGPAPGWISCHHAVLRDRHIAISGGQVWTQVEDKPTLVDNGAEYHFDLDHHCWQRILAVDHA